MPTADRLPDRAHRQLIARIRQLSKQRKMSANKLADFSGIARGSISEILAGRKSPTVRTLVKIAGALDVELRALFE